MQCVLAPAPFVADKINANLEKEWAEFFRLIGIANLVEQKKERLIQDEMTASLGGTIASRYSRYEPRKRAIDEINKKFGKKTPFSEFLKNYSSLGDVTKVANLSANKTEKH